MRLWSLHPSELDQKGLVALWREGLLAKHVLEGRTKGYLNHPQLDRFKAHQDPEGAIHAYLAAVLEEAEARGYSFDASKIDRGRSASLIPVTRGQLAHETEHLRKKLAMRDPERLARMKESPAHHPLFSPVPGEIEPWEVL
jgi:hypothetical protein